MDRTVVIDCFPESVARYAAPNPADIGTRFTRLSIDRIAGKLHAAIEVPPELVAQSLGEWWRAWLTRIRSGDSGVLPVILALVIITIVFQAG